ncbi:MAG: magnesium transporter CorA family protein [Patescibacteria group bacterium]
MPRQNGFALQRASVGDLEWVFVSDNQKREITALRRSFGIHPLDLKAVMPPLQRPRMVEREDYLFMILLYPRFDRKTRTIYSSEVDFFITPTRIVTVNPDGLAPLTSLFESFQRTSKEHARVNSAASTTSLSLLYSILTELEEDIFPMLVHLSTDIDEIEARLFRDFEKNLIQELLRIKTNVVNARKSIQAHKTVLRQFMRSAEGRFPMKKTEPYFARLVEQTKEVWDALDVQKDTINALHEANASLIDFRINEIMKTLTVFSVIVFPLTLIAAIFGMNTQDMPLINHPYGFWVILGLMILGVIGMLLFFKKKKWL